MTLLTHAQDSTKKQSFSLGIVVSSVPVQQISGTDTGFVNALSIAPVLELRAASGWGLSYSPSIACSPVSSGIYMHTLSAGYEKYGGKRMDVAFAFNRYFFTSRSAVPYSPLNNEISLFFNYTHSWLRPVIAASFGFGKDTTVTPTATAHDLGVSLGFNHSFSWDDKGIFSSVELTPSVLLNAGTNGYFSFLSTSNYLSHSSQFSKLVKKQSKGKGSGKKVRAADLPSSPFALSNAEAGIEAGLDIGSLSIRPGGSVVLPLELGGDHSLYAYGQVSVQWDF